MAKAKAATEEPLTQPEDVSFDAPPDISPGIKSEVLDSLDLERLEQEIKNGYKTIIHEDIKYHIYLPKQKEEKLVLDFKAELVAKLFGKKILTKEQVMNELRERGVWNDQKEKQMRGLRDEISNVLRDIFMENSKKKPNKEMLQNLNKQRISLELDLAILTDSISYYMDSTLESEIDREIIKYKMYLLIKNENDEQIWNSFDDLEDDANRGRINFMASSAIYFWAGLDPALFDAAPRKELNLENLGAENSEN